MKESDKAKIRELTKKRIELLNQRINSIKRIIKLSNQ